MLRDDAPNSVTGWRQRIAGGLLVAGGGGFVASYFLPWEYAYYTYSGCTDCQGQMRAPADGFLQIFAPLWGPESILLDIVTVAVLIGLPLALVALGVRLLARRQLVRPRWKVLAVGVGVLGVCAAFLLTVVIAVRYVDSGLPALQDEIGKYLAFAGALAVLVAGCVMPSKKLRVVN